MGGYGTMINGQVIRFVMARLRYGMDKFFRDKSGIGTVEIVLIIAVLIGIALIFRDAIIDFAVNLMKSVFGDESIIQDINSSNIRNGNPVN